MLGLGSGLPPVLHELLAKIIVVKHDNTRTSNSKSRNSNSAENRVGTIVMLAMAILAVFGIVTVIQMK